MKKDETPKPRFATNWEVPEQTVAEAINKLLETARTALATQPELAIATAYFNAGGFSLIASELERAPRVRLLLGAEPEREVIADLSPSFEKTQHLNAALESHSAWLEYERDLLGFTQEDNNNAQRLVSWLRSLDAESRAKVEVRKYGKGFLHGKAFIADHDAFPVLMAGSSNFTFAGLSRNAELMIGVESKDHLDFVLEWFNTFWEESEPFDLAELYERRWHEHSPWLVFLKMLWERYGNELDDEKFNGAILKLSPFQLDGVKRALRLMKEIGGVLVADEVGLGKTYIAGEIIMKMSVQERQRVLILAPASLRDGMWNPFLKKFDFSRRIDVKSFAELRQESERENYNSDAKYEKYLEDLDDYGLVVVDEAHNLRNESAGQSKALMRLLGGPNPKKVLLLTATPVNNSLTDLETLIKYFVSNDAAFSKFGIPSISKFIKHAQSLDPESLSPKHLFDLMDRVAVRRTRNFIKKFYPNARIQNAAGVEVPIVFPEPELSKLEYDLHAKALELVEAMVYALDVPDVDRFHSRYQIRRDDPDRLMMARYTPSAYSKSNELEMYQLTNAGLLRSALLKRMESSPIALENTLEKLIVSHESFLDGIENGYVLTGRALDEWGMGQVEDVDVLFERLGEKAKNQIRPASDFHVDDLRDDVKEDLKILERLLDMSKAARKIGDTKADQLIAALTEIAERSERVSKDGVDSRDRRKVIIFSSFTDTVDSIHERVTEAVKKAPSGSPLALYKGRIAPAVSGRSNIEESKPEVIAKFAPESNQGLQVDSYDILVTTDILSEGVNLQQAGQIINYDLPWNPMRIVQRHGRIDRIGSPHRKVHLGLFFPNAILDKLLRLEQVIRRKIAYAAAAVGNVHVIPGEAATVEVNLADARAIEEELDQNYLEIKKLQDLDISILERGGTVSGEEFRRRLFQAIEDSPDLKSQMLKLPYGSGSGFKSSLAGSQGYVFCIRVKKESRPWFIHIPTDANWNMKFDVSGNPIINNDTLTCLTAADPGNQDTTFDLPSDAYSGAYKAWEVASAWVHERWQEMTDINAFQPTLPKAFLDALQLIYQNPGNWSPVEIQDLVSRMNVVPIYAVKIAVRKALDNATSDAAAVEEIRNIIHDAGLQPVNPADPLPPATPEEVRLITWMAISN